MSVYHFEQLDNLNLALHFIAKLVTGGLKRAVLDSDLAPVQKNLIAKLKVINFDAL